MTDTVSGRTGVRSTVSGAVARTPPLLAVTATATCCWLAALGVAPFITVGEDPVALRFVGLPLTVGAVLLSWSVQRASTAISFGLALIAVGGLAPALVTVQSLPGWSVALLLGAGPLALAGYALVLAPPVWFAVPALVASAVHVLAYQPAADPACLWTCTPVNAPLADVLGARNALGWALLVELLAWIAVVVAALRSRRRILTWTAVATSAVALAADAVPWWRWGTLATSTADDTLRVIATGTALVVLAGISLRTARARRGMAELARQLGSPGGSFDGSDVKAVLFAVPGEQRWVDGDGNPAVLPGGAVVLAGPHAEPAVALLLDQVASGGDDEIAGYLTPATRLALDTARLDVVSRLRLAQVRASQRRLIETADAERHRIERDLHDGAQQRLVGVSMHLGLARTRAAGPDADRIQAAQGLVQDALTALRDIAHGELLGVLVTEGLVAALEDLVYSAALDITVDLAASCDLPASTERAVYAVVEALVRSAEASATSSELVVRTGCARGTFRTVAECLGDGPKIDVDLLQSVMDRTSATGGELRVTTNEHGGTRLQGAWPCAS